MAKIFGTPSPYLRERSIHYLSKSTLIAFGSLAIAYVLVQALPLYPNKALGLLATGIFILAVAIPAYKFYKEDDITSENYYRGRKGESVVLEELKKLPDEFRVFCDVKIQHPYNIDFLVTGPTGIFTLEVKSHSGKIDYENGRVTINGLVPKEKDFLRQAKGEAGSVADYLREKVPGNHWVYPVLVFSNSNATMHFGLKPVEDVLIVGRRFLLSLLQSGEGRVTESGLQEAERALQPTISEIDID